MASMSMERISITNQPLRRLSRKEYDKLVEQGVFGDERVELVFGMVVAMSPIDPSHVQSTARLSKVLTIALGDRAQVICQAPPSYAWSYGRFVNVLAVCNHETGWSSSGNLSRPVACTDEVECPQFKGAEGPRRFECRSGLCQRSDTTGFPPTFINSSDASDLCYARFARVDTFGPLNPIGQQVSDWVNSVCPSNFSSVPCTLPLPDGCMQP
jgi:hypothetical protein